METCNQCHGEGRVRTQEKPFVVPPVAKKISIATAATLTGLIAPIGLVRLTVFLSGLDYMDGAKATASFLAFVGVLLGSLSAWVYISEMKF